MTLTPENPNYDIDLHSQFNHKLNDKWKTMWYSDPRNQEQLLLQKGTAS